MLQHTFQKKKEKKGLCQKKRMPECRVCHGEHGPVSPSRAKYNNYICSYCNNKQANSDPARYLARKMARRYNPGTAFVRKVIAKCGGCSVLSGEDEWKRLCVTRINPEEPWNLDNAILVTSAEGYALSRMRTPEQRQRLLRRVM
jgi:hypothetical protein